MDASVRANGEQSRAIPGWIAPLTLLASGAYLQWHWNEIPDRWIVHWGAGGVPNGWASRTPANVFFPLAMGAGLWLFMELVAIVVRVAHRAKPGHEPIARAGVDLVRMLEIAVSLFFAITAVTMPLMPVFGPGVIVLSLLGFIAVAMTMGGIRLARAVKVARANAPAGLEGYHGIYYSNPKDARLWVPKLIGLGWTINFAHPMAWPVMVLLVGVPIVFAIATIVLVH